jgi:hypothetical protein
MPGSWDAALLVSDTKLRCVGHLASWQDTAGDHQIAADATRPVLPTHRVRVRAADRVRRHRCYLHLSAR